MRGESGQYILLDTGFLFALLSPRDEHHERANRIYDQIEKFHGLVPWPVLYEVLNTKLVRGPDRLGRLKVLLQSPGIRRIADEPYREGALAECFEGGTSASLVDRVLAGVVLDPNVRVHAIVTFNPRDFTSAARKRRIAMIGQ